MRAHCFKDQVAWSPHPALFTIESVPDFKPTQYPVPELLGLKWDFCALYRPLAFHLFSTLCSTRFRSYWG